MPVGESQRSATKFLIFAAEKINTRLARNALPENEAAWLENLQPIGPNNLVAVPAANPALVNIGGAFRQLTPSGPQVTLFAPQAVQTIFPANIGNVDYLIVFTQSGAALAVNIGSGALTAIAAPGTFSNPDMTVFASSQVLIIDPLAGYCTWNGTVFVRRGSVSPNIKVTAGGTGYTSPPSVTIGGGSGSGATAHAVVAGGAVVSAVMDNPGVAYQPGDTLTVTFGGPGAGATATAIIWPVIAGTTIAVFAGRVWTANGRVLSWTGTAGFDDTNPANAAGTTTVSDADLSHTITGLRTLNNFLYIFGDSSVRQIGAITVQSSITLFTPLILASDIGTTFPLTIQSYNRLVLFANKNGVYAIFGASVEKISDDLDGIFAGSVDFSFVPCAALNDIRNIHCYLLLLRYLDPLKGPRSILAVFMEKKWFIISQGDSLRAITSAPLASTAQVETFGSSGGDITQLLQDSTTAVAVTWRTALSAHGNAVQAKQTLRAGVSALVSGVDTITMEIDTETSVRTYTLTAAPAIVWLNNSGGIVQFVNNSGGTITFCGTGFQFPFMGVDGYGKFLGATITVTAANLSLNGVAIEYQDKDVWGNAI
jgi:hypothetical protein